MTTTKKSRSKTRRSPRQPKAIALLTKDHKHVDSLFRKFQRLDEDAEEEKRALLEQICTSLTIHATIEEEIFYPEVRAALEDDEEASELLDAANVEHTSIKALVAQLEGADPGDEMVSGRVKVLGEYVKHHVKEEEGELFSYAKKAKELDLDELGDRLEERKAELEAEAGLEPAVARSNGTGRARARR